MEERRGLSGKHFGRKNSESNCSESKHPERKYSEKKYFLKENFPVIFGVIIMTMVSVFVIAGCGNALSNTEEKETGGQEKIQIGMIFDNFIMERWQRDRDVFVSTAKELGAEVNVQNANSSVDEQITLMEYFIKKKVDAIVLIPIDSLPLVPYVKKAQDAGIKVISYDRLVVGAMPDLYISFDNKRVGMLMAQMLSSRLEAGDKTLMICGPVTDNNVAQVEAGFKEVMLEKNIDILEVYYADEWKAEHAAAYIRQNSRLAGQIKGLMCGNDNLAQQAIAALAELRLAGEIYVTGQDADLAACQRIVEGTQYMTVYKPVEKLAARAAQETVKLVQTGKTEWETFIAADGAEIPYIRLEPVGVTADNMEEIIIGGGFHLKEDVYLNRPDLLD